MSWKIDGKIGFLISNQGSGQAHWDTHRLLFQPPGSTTQEEIEKVYYLPASVCASLQNMTEAERNTEIAKWLVWKRYWEEQKTLVAGTLTVCIEVDLKDEPNDINLSNFAIFTADSESSTTVNVGIFHESGIVVYKSNVDNIDYNTSEKYGLSGERRVVQSISNVVLKKGLKYYIQYTNTNNPPFKPAYFSEGSGNYLNWSNGNLQQKSVADLNSVAKYLGVISNVSTWLTADENDFMISEIGQGGLTNSNAYIRNATTVSTIGEIGTALSVSEKDKLLRLSSGSIFAYLGNDYVESYTKILDPYHIYTKNNTLDNTKYKGIKTTAKGILDDLNQYDYCIYNGDTIQSIVEKGHIYQKTGNITIDDEIDLTSISGDVVKIMAILNKSASSTPYGNIAIEKGSINNTNYTGYVFTLKSGYYRDFGQNDAGYTCATVPSVDKTIYYITDTGSLPGGGYAWTAGLWFYDSTASGDKWVFVAQDGNVSSLSNYLDMVTFASAIQEMFIASGITLNGDLTELAKTYYNGNYISNDLRGETVQTDKKFYLEINGREV